VKESKLASEFMSAADGYRWLEDSKFKHGPPDAGKRRGNKAKTSY
jgi:hypothetical protein